MKIMKFRSIQIVSVIAFSAGVLVGCDKGGNTPKDWQPDNMMKMRCSSPRAFAVEQLNEVRLKMKNKELTVVKTQDISNGDDKTDANMISIHSVSDFANSEEQVQVAIDCTTLTASYVGPGVPSQVQGKLTRISTTTLTIVGKNMSTQEQTTVELEKEMPDRKAEKTAYAIAANKDAEGYNTLKITITTVGADGKKSVRKIKQWTDLDTVAVQKIKDAKVNAGVNPPVTPAVPAKANTGEAPTNASSVADDVAEAQAIQAIIDEQMPEPATFTLEDYRNDPKNPKITENLTYDDLIKIATSSDEAFLKATDKIDAQLKAQAAENEQKLEAEAKAAVPAPAANSDKSETVNASGTCEAGSYDEKNQMCMNKTEVEVQEEQGMSMLPEEASEDVVVASKPAVPAQTVAAPQSATLIAEPMRASREKLNGPMVEKLR